LVNIFIFSAAESFDLLTDSLNIYEKKPKIDAIQEAVSSASDNFVHYIIAAIYILVAFETRALLKQDDELKPG